MLNFYQWDLCRFDASNVKWECEGAGSTKVAPCYFNLHKSGAGFLSSTIVFHHKSLHRSHDPWCLRVVTRRLGGTSSTLDDFWRGEPCRQLLGLSIQAEVGISRRFPHMWGVLSMVWVEHSLEVTNVQA